MNEGTGDEDDFFESCVASELFRHSDDNAIQAVPYRAHDVVGIGDDGR